MLLPVGIVVLGARSARRSLPLRSVLVLRAAVEILGIDPDDVEVVAQLTRFGGEAEVGDGGDGDGAELEAGGPVLVGLVLQLELERGVLEVGEAGPGGLRGAPDPSSL